MVLVVSRREEISFLTVEDRGKTKECQASIEKGKVHSLVLENVIKLITDENIRLIDFSCELGRESDINA